MRRDGYVPLEPPQDETFEPNSTVELRHTGGAYSVEVEDYGTYLVAEKSGHYFVVSRELRIAVSYYKTLKVAQQFAQQFPLDYPHYIEVVQRMINHSNSEDDRDYFLAAEDKKKHVDYIKPQDVHMITRRE